PCTSSAHFFENPRPESAHLVPSLTRACREHFETAKLLTRQADEERGVPAKKTRQETTMDDRHDPDADCVLFTRVAEHGVWPMTSRCETIASCPGEAPLGLRRVLIVEDNPRSRDLLRCLLERQGHHVDVAATGREGVRVGVSRPHDAVVFPPEGAELRRE